jgi:aryl-alcohol dehydrogenase-like predicted oxidoreductase
MTEEGGIKRRTLIKTGLALAAGAGFAKPAKGATGTNAAPLSPAGIPVRQFGKTGLAFPVLGMGGSALVAQWAPSYGVKLGSVEERAAMVRHAFERGVRYFDTARVYQESEAIFGKGLKSVRADAFIASKVADPDPANTRRSVETSLEQLDMDRIDLMQIHSPAIEAAGFDGAMKIHRELVRLRDEGTIGYIGLSTHVAFDTVHRLIDTGGFDQVLLAYGYFNKGMDTLLSNRNMEHRQLCLSRAQELGMGIVAMKVMGAQIFSHNAKNLVPDFAETERRRLPGAAMRWTLGDERVSLMIVGVSKPSDIDDNVETLRGGLAFSDEDRHLLAAFSERAYKSEWISRMRTV